MQVLQSALLSVYVLTLSSGMLQVESICVVLLEIPPNIYNLHKIYINLIFVYTHMGFYLLIYFL